MERDDDRELRDPRTPSHPVVSRRFTTRELEAVIRRAVELQAGSSARMEDGVSEADVVRIGQELGLEPAMVRRAMAEVRARPAEERGILGCVAGAGTVRASRVLRRPAASVAATLDRYLRETELMVVQRRFPDRTRYVRDTSLAAELGRIARTLVRSHPPLKVKQLDVAVSALDEESCLLEVGVDLKGTRGGLVAGVLGGGGALSVGWAATVWATAFPDPLMLIGIPVVAGSWWGMRALYAAIRGSLQDRLESLLDRVEHGELG